MSDPGVPENLSHQLPIAKAPDAEVTPSAGGVGGQGGPKQLGHPEVTSSFRGFAVPPMIPLGENADPKGMLGEKLTEFTGPVVGSRDTSPAGGGEFNPQSGEEVLGRPKEIDLETFMKAMDALKKAGLLKFDMDEFAESLRRLREYQQNRIDVEGPNADASERSAADENRVDTQGTSATTPQEPTQ